MERALAFVRAKLGCLESEHCNSENTSNNDFNILVSNFQEGGKYSSSNNFCFSSIFGKVWHGFVSTLHKNNFLVSLFSKEMVKGELGIILLPLLLYLLNFLQLIFNVLWKLMTKTETKGLSSSSILFHICKWKLLKCARESQFPPRQL